MLKQYPNFALIEDAGSFVLGDNPGAVRGVIAAFADSLPAT